MERRTVLRNSAIATLASMGLAGCSGSNDETPENSDSGGSTPRSTSSPDADNTENQDQPEEQVGLFHAGFEQGMSLWSIEQSNWSLSSEYAYAGEYSAGIEMSPPDTGGFLRTFASATPLILEGGSQIEEFSFYWLELEQSFGGGIRLLNSNNDVEIGVATDNPNWMIDAANGPRDVYGGDGYGRWIRSDISIDWADGTAEVGFEDTQSNETYSGQHLLKHGTDIETIQIRGFTSNQGWQTESCHMYWDEIEISGG